MKKNFLFVLVLVLIPLLLGCKKGRNETVDDDFDIEMADYPGDLFDSLMWAQYHCPEDEEKTVYEWVWAYEVRDTLDIYDIDSLDTLCKNLDVCYRSYSRSACTADMTTGEELYSATARFRMLNAYQALAGLTEETPLGKNVDCYYDDYSLWEALFKEFDEWYKERGNCRFMNLYCYYHHLADLRTEVLLEELDCLTEGGDSLHQFINAKPPQIDREWLKTHPAIRRWYNYRMKMADKLRRHNASQAQCLRALTYKQYTRYVKFEREYEEEYYIEEDEL